MANLPSTPPSPSGLLLPPAELGGAVSIFIQKVTRTLQNAIQATQNQTPQSRTAAPKVVADGMICLARYPWRPVSGQTTDQLVYWDGAGQIWRLLGATPTNTT